MGASIDVQSLCITLEKCVFMLLYFINGQKLTFGRLYEELKIFFGLDLDVPNSDTTLVRDLGKWLKICSTRRKCIVVLDALNQLDDGSKEDGQY